MSTRKILFVASECAPLVKTGGLADVVGSLPRALGELGMDVRVLLPAYPGVVAQLRQVRRVGRRTLFGGEARLAHGQTAAGVRVLALEAPHLYDGAGNPYLTAEGRDRPDGHRRFAALARVGADIAIDGVEHWRPDLVHAHDWQAGLTPVYLRQAGARSPCAFTIHNMAFQGLYPPEVIPELALDPRGFAVEGYEFHGKVGFLKAGLVYADRLTTVSPSYARELATPDFGMGLDGVIRARYADLVGIVNGIDTEVWDPAVDPAIVAPFDRRRLAGKKRCRAALEARFGLPPEPSRPLFAVISRLTLQKGLDLLLAVLPALVARGGRLVVLGTGEPLLERAFSAAASEYPADVGVQLGYDEVLAHQIQAGADAIVVPSRFEPCGLTQLCAMRYGTLPVVARTGGLRDTVIDANHAALAVGCATGFQFGPVAAPALEDALGRAIALFGDQAAWRRTMSNAMAQPVGWDASARAYARLYERALAQRAAA